jgi:four helix bundle protein
MPEPEQQTKTKPESSHEDLEERTFRFAKDVRSFVKEIPKTPANVEDIPQLIRASGSTAANYLEANDALGKKDFLMRLRIARKEAKESRLFLRLIDCDQEPLQAERSRLVQEALELKLILSSIINKSGG